MGEKKIMYEDGRLYTCEHCGKKAFRKKTGTSETDGGYTTWDNFEPLEGWRMFLDINQRLCPECSQKYESLITEFKKQGEVQFNEDD